MAKQIAKPKAEDVMPVEPAPAPVAPPVVPIDTSSDAYKAGLSAGKAGVADVADPNFLAGLAAGMGAAAAEPEIPVEVTAEGEELTEEEKKKLEEEEKPVAKSSVADIRAAFGTDREFVFDALEMNEQGKSMTEMKAAWSSRLSAKLAETQAKLVKASNGQRAVGTAAASPSASANPNDPKAVAAAEWDSDTSLHGKFSTKDRFVAVRAAELSGRLRTK